VETGPPSDVVPERAGSPSPRLPGPGTGAVTAAAHWRLTSVASSIPVLRRRLRALLEGAGVDPDRTYDLLLAATEAATNAVEHAQEPTEPFIDVSATVTGGDVRIDVRDHGQWRERGPSMDRGRGSTLMSAFGQVTATPSPEGTTVVISSSLGDEPSSTAAG
jgi:anti-sigma regulatory factor (Ser/Thr protein kinase)